MPLAAIAAGLLIAVHLWPFGLQNSPAEATWVIATDDDVDILSLQESVGPLLVVGRPPLASVMELVGNEDIDLESITPDDDGVTLTSPQVAGQNAPVLCGPREPVVPVP